MKSRSILPETGVEAGSTMPVAVDLADDQTDELLALGENTAIGNLVHAATHDTLTGLPTRALLLLRLERELARTGDPGQVAVLFVDLDNFKLVNDSLGHQCGDLLLQEMARRIRRCVSAVDTVSRFGGDELVILHPAAAGASEGVLGDRILAVMAEPIVLAGREVVVTASIGVAICDRGCQSAEQLLRDADTALYSAKSRGRARMQRFNEELHARVARRVQIESDLRTALRDGQIFVQFQPQINLQDGRMVGVEALARWRHPVHGLISPSEFIPVAEECRLIGELGRQVLRTACQQLAYWHVCKPEAPLTMTVNVSPRQFEDSTFVAFVEEILRQTGVNASSLCLELTESVLMNRDADTVGMLRQIRALGVYVAIDDFGTEYSSLSRLRDLPVEVLKLDRSFIDGLPAESGDTAIVTSILSLALAMGKHVIAEGVERPEQALALRSMGCVVAQGYLFSRAVDASAVPLLHDEGLWLAPEMQEPDAKPPVGQGRTGHRSFIDEFLDHIGAPMGARPDRQ